MNLENLETRLLPEVGTSCMVDRHIRVMAHDRDPLNIVEQMHGMVARTQSLVPGYNEQFEDIDSANIANTIIESIIQVDGFFYANRIGMIRHKTSAFEDGEEFIVDARFKEMNIRISSTLAIPAYCCTVQFLGENNGNIMFQDVFFDNQDLFATRQTEFKKVDIPAQEEGENKRSARKQYKSTYISLPSCKKHKFHMPCQIGAIFKDILAKHNGICQIKPIGKPTIEYIGPEIFSANMFKVELELNTVYADLNLIEIYQAQAKISAVNSDGTLDTIPARINATFIGERDSISQYR